MSESKGKGRRKPGFVLVIRMEKVLMRVTKEDKEALYVHDACGYLDSAIRKIEKEREIHIVMCSASKAMEVEEDAIRHDLRNYEFAKYIDRYLPGISNVDFGDACVEIAKANLGAYFGVIVSNGDVEFRPDIEEHLVRLTDSDDRFFGIDDDIDRLYTIATKGQKAFRCFEVNTESTYNRMKDMHDVMSIYSSMLRMVEQLEAATANREHKTVNDIMEDKIIVDRTAPVLKTMIKDYKKKSTELFSGLQKLIDDQFAKIELSYNSNDNDHDD